MCELSSVRFAVSPNYHVIVIIRGYNSVGRMLALHLLFCSRSMSWSSIELLLVGSALATYNKYFSISNF